jgi:hypothetical protein
MRRDWLRSAGRGAAETPEPWDEELAPPRSGQRPRAGQALRSPALRRVVLATVVVVLLALVGASIVLLEGDDGKQLEKLSAAATTEPATAAGTAGAFLPTPVTAVSLGGQVVIPDPATTLPPLLTVPGQTTIGPPGTDAQGQPTLPGATAPPNTAPGGTQPVTTQPGTTRPATTAPGTTRTTAPPTTRPTTTTPPTTAPTTTQPPPFTYDQPHSATGVFTNGQGSAACSAPVPPERQGQFVLATPQPGVLTIQRQGAAGVASGPIDPSGTFHVSSATTGETYDGQASSSSATASYLQDDGNGCTVTYDVVFTFT